MLRQDALRRTAAMPPRDKDFRRASTTAGRHAGTSWTQRGRPQDGGSGAQSGGFGSPDLETLTTSHIERVFLTVRQELTRFTRKTLGYSKDLATHKQAIALLFGVYNFVRKHKSLGTTPAVAAGIEEERWSLERVVEMTEAYWQPKFEAAKQAKAAARRIAEDAEFEKALAGLR